LKPENIVFSLLPSSNSEDISAKIIDFGVGKCYKPQAVSIIADIATASQEEKDRHRLVTNPYWRSPESWLGVPWGPPTDIWSLGAIVRVVLLGFLIVIH
jgi:serine/threonine protein kinase